MINSWTIKNILFINEENMNAIGCHGKKEINVDTPLKMEWEKINGGDRMKE